MQMVSVDQDLKWFVLYTAPKLEKQVASSIAEMGIESYVPLQSVVRQWSDRKKKLIVPLFPGYVFVKIARVHRTLLFSIKGVIKFVSIDRRPVEIKEIEILTIKKLLVSDSEPECEKFYHQGMRVKISYGQFEGLSGIIVNKNGKDRLIVLIEGLMKAFSINVPSVFVKESPDVLTV